MRIDLYGSGATDAAASSAPSASVPAKSAPGVGEDTATLSAGSVSVPSLVQQALAAAEARLVKVDALQRAVGSGAYTLDPHLIAEALISQTVS